MASRDEIVSYLNQRLNTNAISDSSVNGLQVEGACEIRKIALAADATLQTYKKAVMSGCQMMITHHGLIWHGIRSVTGREYRHIKYLLDNGLNLYASHLPLDMHPELGNNITLGKMLNLSEIVPFGEYHGNKIGISGKLPSPATCSEIAAILKRETGVKNPICLTFGNERVKSVAVISGGGASGLTEAIKENMDLFITGEGSHQAYHLAQEASINVLFIGHYYSETCGVKMVGEDLKRKFKVETVFIDEPTVF
ncbi:MAG: Nif3-like dinuclear metal center hexameric protein [Oligoflexales bacterium]|nr:Nif3-like dinuclear metal center hexameric protein [Oligoflexales bacterium]